MFPSPSTLDLSSQPVPAWPAAPVLTHEHTLADAAGAAAIEAFWNRFGRFGRFVGAGGLSLAGAAFRRPDLGAERGAIVVVNGRTESLLKYAEVAYDLWHNGYSVYLYDHRGQGLSEREPEVASPQDRDRGHVGRFDDYVDDLGTYLREQVAPAGHRAHFLLAHSMGAPVSALLLEGASAERTLFSAVALVSPMFALAGLGSLPLGPLAGRVAEVATSFGLSTRYALPNGAYHPVAFEGNPYTRSRLRYERWRATFEQAPDTRLGAPTLGWVDTSCKAMQRACDQAGRIAAPVLLLTAGADRVVHPSGAEAFWSHLPQPAASDASGGGHARLAIDDARHELLIEVDESRDRALGAVLAFYAAHER